MSLRSTIVSVGLFGLLGCNGTTLDVSSYKTTCTNDIDCIAVQVGDVCALCGCPNGSIAATDQAKYQKDFDSIHKGCPPNSADCAPCDAMVGYCLDGACSIRPQ